MQRRRACGWMWAAISPWAMAAAAVAFAAEGDDRAAAIEPLRALAGAGRHEEVLARAKALLDALPADSRPTAWSLDFRGHRVEDIRIGRRYVYFQMDRGRSRALDGRPDLEPAPEHAPPGGDRFDALLSVTCVDGETGLRIWSRHFLPHTQLALDPRDDALWAWHREPGSPILRIDPATGNHSVRGTMPAERGTIDAFRGLRVDGRRIWAYATRNTRDLAVDDELDLDSHEVRSGVYHPALSSPNRLRVLKSAVSQSPGDVSTTVMLVPPVAGVRPVPDWSFESRGYCDNPPVWFGDDVLILAGTSTTYGCAIRLDGRTGSIRWTNPLPEPAHSPGRGSVGGGTYPPQGWSAIGEAAGKVIAVGAFGTVFFWDPETGAEVARLSTRTLLLGLPRVIGSRLVLAGQAGLRAVPLGRVLRAGPKGDDWLALQELRARSSLALGRPADALAIAEEMSRELRDDATGWTLRAEALEALNRGPEAVAARVAAMAASGVRESAALRASHGLLWRLPTAPVLAAPVVAGPLLLVGCQDGRLLTIDTRGLRVLETERVATDVATLTLDGPALVRRGHDRRDVPIRTFAPPPRDLLPHDPLLRPDEPRGLPAAWYSAMAGDGPSIAVRDRRVRGLQGGRVRVLQAGEVLEWPPGVEGIEWWRVASIDGEPVGYGTGGVYRLDANFRPVERIIDAGRSQGRPNQAYLLAGDKSTLCVVIGAFKSPRLQVWTRDARRLLREVPIRMPSSPYRESYRLRPLGEGYLLSAGELVWVSKEADGPLWRFRIAPESAPSPSQPEFERDYAGFGVPRVVGDRLFVAARGGGVYGFALPLRAGMAGRPESRKE